MPEDFDTEVWNGEKNITIKYRVTDENDKAYAVEEEYELLAEFGNTYRLNLSGDVEKGFTLR